jgi:Ser/Thr protein kinase RdoA (MazF antagonist)
MTTVVQKAPRVTLDDAVEFAAELYGLRVTASALPSERDQNFSLRTVSGEQFVLKIANAEENLDFLNFQNHLIRFLAARKLDLEFPRIVPARNGDDLASITTAGSKHFVRLLTWLDGVCFADIKQPGRKLLASLGRALAQMDAALDGFSHLQAHRSFLWDLRNTAARDLIGLLPVDGRRLVERFFAEWEKVDWGKLRFSIIHNDANDYNILVRGPTPSERRVSAILDYGDVVHSATVCNLAVALAYVMLDKSDRYASVSLAAGGMPAYPTDPIGTAAQVVTAYHETYPLTEAEIDSLYTLAVTRLCFSVCIAARQTRDVPDNEYLNISNAPAWSLLERLQHIPFDWPTRVFRYACGMPVVKEQPQILRPRRTPAELLTARQRHLGSSLSVSYESPLHIVSASRQNLFDDGGQRYLDCVNNVAHVGHSHPRVVRAGTEQMAILNTNTRYLHEHLIEYGERLIATLPDPLRVVYLVNSGSEANELALRLARAHTNRTDVIVIDCAYHGNTTAMIDLSPYKFDGPGGHGCPLWVQKVPLPDVYRGKYRGDDAGTLYAREVSR